MRGRREPSRATRDAPGDMRDRVGKFLCVVPPKALRVNRTNGSAMRETGTDALEDALNALEFNKSSSALDGGGAGR